MSRSIRVRAPERLSAIPTSTTPAGDRATPKIRHSRRLWPWITFAGDIASLAGAFFIAYWLRYGLQFGPELTPFQFASLNAYWPVGVGFGATALLQLYLHGAYERGRRFRWLDESPKLINSLLFATAAVIVVFFLFRPAFFSRLMFGYLFVVSVGTLSASRVIVRWIAALRHRRGLDIDNVVVVGSGNAAKMLMQQMHAGSGLGLRLVGFVDDARENGRDFGRFQRLGAVDQLDELCDQHSLDRVFIALPPSTSETAANAIASCRRVGVSITIVPDLVELQTGRIDTDNIAGIPLVTLTPSSIRGFRSIQKRLLDTTLATLALLVLWPLVLIVTLAIKLDSRGSVLFKQKRIGRAGKPFNLYKFRSMVADAEELRKEFYPDTQSELLFKRRDDERRTRVGRMLRKTSIDELPQLINVFRGEMSLVGPRAQVPEEVALYDAWAQNRLEAPPGMTGLWQVSGRSNLTFEEMVMMDTYYIGHWSLGLDLKILARTIPAVIRGDGAY